MKRFKCNNCMNVYMDSYPVDDTCKICKSGTVRITEDAATILPFGIIVDMLVVNLQVLKSNAGFYIGYFSYLDGPIDRVSSYYATKEEASIMLKAIIENEKVLVLYGVEGDEYRRDR